MGFLFKKRDVPDELPSLADDQISNSVKAQNSVTLEVSPTSLEKKTLADTNPIQKEDLKKEGTSYEKSDQASTQDSAKISNSVDDKSNDINNSPKAENMAKEEISNSVRQKRTFSSHEEEIGYFKEMITNLTNEVESMNKLKEYDKEFMKEDIVNQMKTYWENQKPEIILKNVGGETKQRLLDKIEKLHVLEKEWQALYFEIIEKEEKIREEEKELKIGLSELISLYRSALNKKSK